MKTFQDFGNYVKQNKVSRCIVRCDLNIPSDTEDLSRIYAIKDTVLSILDMGINVVLISHYKRPKLEDIIDPKFSLKNIVPNIERILNRSVSFIRSSVFDMEPDSIDSNLTLLENLRFYEGETKNDPELAKRLSMFADVYVNDAFSVSHRAHASVCEITKYLPSFAGLSLQREIAGISKVTEDISRPFMAIIGGSKVSSKIDVLKELSMTTDFLAITGAMANTFISAKGVDLKSSMIEKDQFGVALKILEDSKAQIILPTDFVISKDINEDGIICDDISNVPDGFACFDIGPKTSDSIKKFIERSKTVLWNGALGAFEFSNFDGSSKAISEFIAKRTKLHGLVSVIGGGETVASIGRYKDDMSFVSTAGGAFLEFVSGYKLPGIECLQG